MRMYCVYKFVCVYVWNKNLKFWYIAVLLVLISQFNFQF